LPVVNRQGGERADPVLGERGDAVERIELDEMFERLGEQRFVLDDQDAEHDLPSPQPARFFTEKAEKGIPY